MQRDDTGEMAEMSVWTPIHSDNSPSVRGATGMYGTSCAFVAAAAALHFRSDRNGLMKMHSRVWNLTNYYRLSLCCFREGDREQKAEEQSVKGTFVQPLFLLSNGEREVRDCCTG